MSHNDHAFSPGDSLPVVLPAMMRSAGVAQVTVEKVSKSPSFRGGAVSEQARAITGPARAEHRRRGFGFWEFALERAVSADPPTRRALLRGALSHEPADRDQRSMLTVDELADGLTSGAWNDLPARAMVNLCSTVSTADGRTRHLVLLDFGMPATWTSSTDAACEVVQALGLSGALFTSGRSFHFVSAAVATRDEMHATLARAQLLSPLIDTRWASHQLIDSECRLRISTDMERNTAPHQLIRSVQS